MADTKRTKAALATLLADNTTGDISAQDVRDVLESFDLSRGGCYWTAYATTTMTLQGSGGPGGTNYYKLQGTTVSRMTNRFSHASPNRLTYIGAPTIRADFFAAFSYSVAGIGTADIAFAFYVNGAFNTPSYQVQQVTLGAKSQIVVTGEGNLALNDYIELWVANESAAGQVLTPAAGYVFIQEMPLG